MRTMGFVLLWLGCGLLLPAVASAQSAPNAAVLAAQVKDEHCTEVAGGDSKAAGQAMQPVTEAWVQVSQAFEASPEPYLLYWRGVLAQCLSQEEKAESDLTEFSAWFAAASPSDRRIYSDLDRDARKRVARLQRGAAAPKQADPGFVVAGLAAVGGGGVLGGLAGWQAAETQSTYDLYVAAGDNKDFDALQEQGDATWRASIWLAAGAGVAAAVGSVLLALSSRGPTPRAALVVPVPQPGGLALVIGGRW